MVGVLARLFVGVLLLTPAVPAAAADPLLADQFTRPDGLITNEYAYWSTSGGGTQSPTWEMTSGSLFAKDQHAWTGVPDATVPNATSSNGTGSAIFRLTTKRADFGDVTVSFALLNKRMVSTKKTKKQAWDGVHVLLRYQSEESLYALSVNRRDGAVVVKKKVPGGPSNGGTYYTLASGTKAVPYGAWQQVSTRAATNSDGSVTLTLSRDGRQLLSVTDRGTGGPPITTPGKVGVRGDNDEFQFDDFTVSAS
jgi:hypothetical protein